MIPKSTSNLAARAIYPLSTWNLVSAGPDEKKIQSICYEHSLRNSIQDLNLLTDWSLNRRDPASLKYITQNTYYMQIRAWPEWAVIRVVVGKVRGLYYIESMSPRLPWKACKTWRIKGNDSLTLDRLIPYNLFLRRGLIGHRRLRDHQSLIPLLLNRVKVTNDSVRDCTIANISACLFPIPLGNLATSWLDKHRTCQFTWIVEYSYMLLYENAMDCRLWKGWGMEPVVRNKEARGVKCDTSTTTILISVLAYSASNPTSPLQLTYQSYRSQTKANVLRLLEFHDQQTKILGRLEWLE